TNEHLQKLVIGINALLLLAPYLFVQQTIFLGREKSGSVVFACIHAISILRERPK
ncbi:MAG: hypothetical protein RLZZ64_1253, partial [Bacteroidota bacterium]